MRVFSSAYDPGVIDRLLRSRRFVVGAAVFVLALVGVFAGYLTGGGEASSSLPPAPPVPQTYVRGTVQSLSGDQLTIGTNAGARTLKLPADAPVETLRPADPGSIARGDWVNGGAVPNNQTQFALTALVLIRQAQLGVLR